MTVFLDEAPKKIKNKNKKNYVADSCRVESLGDFEEDIDGGNDVASAPTERHFFFY
jgi:hypothetical protein